MKRRYLIAWPWLSALIALSIAPANAQGLVWHWEAKPEGDCWGRSTAVDADGNVYVVGDFRGTVSFGETRLVSSGSTDVFIAKLSRAGTYAWAVRAGGAGEDEGINLAVTPDGTVLLAATFMGPLAQLGSINLRGSTLDSASYSFVAQLTSSGKWCWDTKVAGRVSSLAIDRRGSCYVTGNFYKTRLFGKTTLTSAGRDDVFVGKITGGEFEWAVRAGGAEDDYGVDLAVDPVGNVYLTGSFESSTARFGAVELRNSGKYDDIFVARLSAAGAWQWATPAGGQYRDIGNALAIDQHGVYVAGTTHSPQTYFGPITQTREENAENLFIACLTPAGKWQWVTEVIGADIFYSGLVAARDGSLFLAGTFSSPTATFGRTTLVNSGGHNTDLFMAKLSPAGKWGWAIGVHKPNLDFCQGLSLDETGNFYLTGAVESSVRRPRPGEWPAYLEPDFESAAFIAKLRVVP